MPTLQEEEVKAPPGEMHMLRVLASLLQLKEEAEGLREGWWGWARDRDGHTDVGLRSRDVKI